jgi:hypothetical protein
MEMSAEGATLGVNIPYTYVKRDKLETSAKPGDLPMD